MKNILSCFPVAIAAVALFGACTQSAPPKATASAPVQTPAEAARTLNALLEEYFEQGLALNAFQATFLGDPRYMHSMPNSLSPGSIEARKVINRYWLDLVEREVDRGLLTGQDALSYDVFVSQRRARIQGERFPAELIPLTQFFSTPSLLGQFGSGQSAQPFRTAQDYENWWTRARGIAPLFDQMIRNMRLGVERGITQPKVLMAKVLPQLASLSESNLEKSIWMMPLKNLPKDLSDTEKERLTREHTIVVQNVLLPAYRRLHEFVRDEYLPAARDTHGYWDLPDGAAWYAYQVKQNTTTDLTPDELHTIGLEEVQRIQDEMRQVMKDVGFEGTLQDFFEHCKTNPAFYAKTEEELLNGFRALQTELNEKIPALFDVFPTADYEIRPVEAFRAQSSAGASYQPPSSDGSRPGIFYVNTFNLKAQPLYGMETLAIHEASPGHHFQITIAQELEALPRFRRFGGYTAYAEGWALYAESIGKEMGMFTDPMSWYGRLSDELFRAMRLVVDTGLHHKKWSREKAIEYMLSNCSMSETDIVAEVERYMAIPGQALSYKTGQLAIQRMRDKAERVQGDAFDIKAFHRQILIDGALPLDVLEAKVDRWLAGTP